MPSEATLGIPLASQTTLSILLPTENDFLRIDLWSVVLFLLHCFLAFGIFVIVRPRPYTKYY